MSLEATINLNFGAVRSASLKLPPVFPLDLTETVPTAPWDVMLPVKSPPLTDSAPIASFFPSEVGAAVVVIVASRFPPDMAILPMVAAVQAPLAPPLTDRDLRSPARWRSAANPPELIVSFPTFGADQSPV